jgi:hypothetical protein
MEMEMEMEMEMVFGSVCVFQAGMGVGRQISDSRQVLGWHEWRIHLHEARYYLKRILSCA